LPGLARIQLQRKSNGKARFPACAAASKGYFSLPCVQERDKGKEDLQAAQVKIFKELGARMLERNTSYGFVKKLAFQTKTDSLGTLLALS
jgi:hypothetical protein